MSEQGRGADPTRVIARMSNQLGEMHTQLAAAYCIIEDLETEVELLKSQQTQPK